MMLQHDTPASVLVPREITSARLVSSTVPEPDAARVFADGAVGEVAWNPATSYAIGQRAVLVSTHRVYRNRLGGVDAASPELDANRWFDEGPTNRWAWADAEVSTATVADSPMSVVLEPGAVTDLGLYGLANVDEVRVRLWETAGGVLLVDQLYTTEDFMGADLYWAFFFDEPRQRSQLVVSGLPASTSSRVQLDVSSFNGEPVSVGMVAMGVFETLGSAEYGATASPQDYSRVTTDEYGTTKVVRGRSAKDLRATLHMHRDEANAADALVYRLLGVPVVLRLSTEAAYDYLTSYGLLSADITPAGPSVAKLNLTLKGIV